MGDITENFSYHEFTCKCGCFTNNIQIKLVAKLQTAKDWLQVQGHDIPFVITSGVRCQKHNAAQGGKPNSSHVTGWAADIQCVDNEIRGWMIPALIHAGFTRIGVDKDHHFVHCDCDESKPTPRFWVYPL